MASVLDIAAYILKQHGPMSAMKLQKLVYYSQAWHLVWDDAPIFEEEIEAWANGPVVRKLWHAHRGRYRLTQDEHLGGDADLLTQSERETVDAVCKHYGDWTAQQLSDLTHQEAPWCEAREGLAPTQRGDAHIELAVMADYYGSLYSAGG